MLSLILFDLNVKKRTGRVAMLGGVTNDGQLNSTGKVMSFAVQDKLKKRRKRVWD